MGLIVEIWCFLDQNGSYDIFHFSHDCRGQWSTSFEVDCYYQKIHEGGLIKEVKTD